ncbi:spermatogenesis- and oogenesis-specific basic helix-loop-helix-containing protein 1 [Nannospalax galili]|uniref:spermatogenesis- and oogenesis-specific basic helix-loop-helix-containing protein 1 n=1 Tax=Nannospalax galili TaxID=1026970 RepID=UPI0004ED1B7D|nr:spermatogenesis- and oogenesis-specific basic helix-loop-helix-containing protein 1 [Nannospalax galili]
MASSSSKPAAADPGVEGCRILVAAAKRGPCLRRNVVSERERRRRISQSCEHLRALLPQFEGRREDMASVLEMSVRFLQLAHSLAPSWKPLFIPPPSQDTWHTWESDAGQVTLSSQITDSKPDPETAAVSSVVTQVQEPLCCGPQGVDKSQTLVRVSELLERPPSCPGNPKIMLSCQGWTRIDLFSPSEPSNMSPGLPAWIPHSQQSTSPHKSEDFPDELYQAGSLARDTESPDMLLEEESSLDLTHVPDARYTAGSDLEDRASFLLTASSDWWSGLVAGRGGTTLARSSPIDWTELEFTVDSESSSQELKASPPELWGLDLGSSCSLALKDDMDSLFPDFFPC